MDLEKYIKKKEYNPDIDKTEIWIGNFSDTPEYDPIDIISGIILIFKRQNNKIIIDDFLQYNSIRNWKKPLIFNNITFNEGIQFIFNSFDYEVKFTNCIFCKNVLFGKCHFYEKLEFTGCFFALNADFQNVVFSKKTTFLSTKFEGLNNDFSGSHFYENTSFENIIVKSNITFSNTEFKQKVSFENAIFEGCTDFNTLFRRKTNFLNCSFSQETNFSKVIFEDDTNFSRSTFSVISFQDTIFSKNVRFHQSIFKNNVDFFNTSFKKMVDFYLAEFYEAQQFHTTDFLDRAIISNTIFHKEAQFLYNKVKNDSYINFESTKFKRGLDISRSNFNCNLNFFNVKVEEEGDEYIFKHLEEVKYKDDFGEHREEAVPSVYQQLRETYRIIKNNFYSQNNRIEGLRFHKKEMLVYEKEIKSNSSKNNEDKILLLANKISSNFGTSWSRGVLFTVSAGIITLLPISCNLKFSLTSEGIGNFLKALVDILNLTDWNDMTILGEKLTNWQYIFLFIGRIFIAYGIYQTVQAFRKYGKS